MRKLLKILGSMIALGVLAAVLWPLRVYVTDGFTSSPYVSFLKDHHQVIELNGTETTFDFPKRFYEHRLFFFGESHGSRTVQRVDLALIGHLQREIGLRWLMAELSPLVAHRFNQFLDTGDVRLVAPIFSDWRDSETQWGNQQFFEKLQDLRAFNQTLPTNQRIRFFGVNWLDADRIAEAEELINSGTLEPEEADYLRANIDYTRNEDGRYTIIMHNIESMVRDFGVGDDEPLYAFWGIFHVLRAAVNESARPLAMHLADSDLPFADGIVSLSTVFVDSEQNLPSRILPGPLQSDGVFTDFPIDQDNPYLNYLSGIGDLKKVANDNEVVIFRINAPDSPYRNSTRLRQQSGLLTMLFRFEIAVTPQVATDYVVLVQNSPAVEAFEG